MAIASLRYKKKIPSVRKSGPRKSEWVRVYHFLPEVFALDDIQRRRIKISEIDGLNDPFELWCVYQKEPQLRTALRSFKKVMSERFGLICFSKDWHNPLLWSHYADGHRGICLGFDVDVRGMKPVTYVKQRPRLKVPPTLEDSIRLLFFKFADWQYEKEWRNYIGLDERDQETGFFFYPFDNSVRLREVIAGPLCDVSEATLRKALEGCSGQVRLTKARLAFRSFRIVKNKLGFPGRPATL